MAILVKLFLINIEHCSKSKSLSTRLFNFGLFVSIFYISANISIDFLMNNSHSASNVSSVLLNQSYINPHPPNVPFHNKNEAILKTRQRRYTHQNSEQKNEVLNLDNREIKSAGSSTYVDPVVDRTNFKSKVSSAPSPRIRPCIDSRSSTLKRETGLYTFDSVPSLIQDNTDVSIMPRTKRKENLSKFRSSSPILSHMHNESELPSLVVCKSLRPCKSEASPVTATPCHLRVLRRSLQQMSKEKVTQLSHKSTQNSFYHSKKLDNIPYLSQCLSSLEIQNNEPINLTQYRLPNDVSESFEAKILASLVAQNALEENFINHTPALLSHFLTSKDLSGKISAKVTPRTEGLMLCGSYSDEESSVTTTGPGANCQGNCYNLGRNVSDRLGMHNEWKHHVNCSQDTSRSTDFINSITDSLCTSAQIDDINAASSTQKSSTYQDYLLVNYIPDYGCFYDPKTGIFYEAIL